MNRRLGVLGGGQLGRMLALAAHPLGIAVSVLDPNPRAPAQAVAHHVVSNFDDPEGLRQLGNCDWVTFEFENVPDAAAAQLAAQGPVFPPVAALSVSQDRWIEKNRFLELGIPTPRFLPVDSIQDAEQAFAKLGPMIMKTRRFGYDGKGQAAARTKSDVASAYAKLSGAPAIAEQIIAFDREISALACRSQNGELLFYPMVENIHHEGILRTTIAPAPDLPPQLVAAAERAVAALMNNLNYVGVLALELFVVGEQLIANEFAPRVHNSGHWTIEGAFTSQFENHVRAVCGLPLGSTALRCPAVMTNLIGSIPDKQALLKVDSAHLHDYGKDPRAGRKVGHVTVLGTSISEALAKTKQIEALL